MTKGGAAIPIRRVTSGPVKAGPAIAMFGYYGTPTDRALGAGPALPVRVITDSDLRWNGGAYVIAGDAQAIPVYDAPGDIAVMAGPAIPVYMVTYYVDFTGGNDSNDGRSPSTAWKTLAKVNASTFLSGSQINLKRGETWTVATGQYALVISSANVTVDAYGTGALPVIAGNPTDLNAYCVHLAGNDDKIRNVKLTTAREGAIRVGGAGCEVSGCELTNVGAGVRVYGASASIHGNNIHHLKMVVNDATAGNDYGAVGVWLLEGSNGARIYNNTASYCQAPSTDFTADGGFCEFWGSVDDVHIYGNFALHCNGFCEMGGPTADADTISNVLIYNNLVSQSGNVVYIHCAGDTSGVTVIALRIEFNTLYSASNNVFGFSSIATPLNDNIIFRNNACGGYRAFLNVAGETLFTHDHNVFSGDGPLTLGAGEVDNADPKIVAAPTVDMTFDSNVLIHSNNDSCFDYTNNAGKFAISSAAALNGSLYGVAVTVTSSTTFRCGKNVLVPNNIWGIWVDFWFDPNSMVFTDGADEFQMAIDLLSAAPNSTWQAYIKAAASPYRLNVVALNDAGAKTNANVTISDAPHHLRLHMTRAATNVSADGTATWYVDDMVTPVSAMTGIDNYDAFLLIREYRVGNLFSSHFTSAGGAYYIDQFRVTFESALGTDVATDFSLGAGSPCKGTGVASSIAIDYAGTVRSNPPSIGAYE